VGLIFLDLLEVGDLKPRAVLTSVSYCAGSLNAWVGRARRLLDLILF